MTTTAWQLERAQTCVFEIGGHSDQMNYVNSVDLVYPRIPWFAIAWPAKAWRFYLYARANDTTPLGVNVSLSHEDAADAIKELPAKPLRSSAVCVFQAGPDFPTQSVVDSARFVDVYAVVARENCAKAEAALGAQRDGWVRCVVDLPLLPLERRYVQAGPGRQRRKVTLFFRRLALCRDLIWKKTDQSQHEYKYILATSANATPVWPPIIERSAIYATVDGQLVGHGDEMLRVLSTYDFMMDRRYWGHWYLRLLRPTCQSTLSRRPALRLLCLIVLGLHMAPVIPIRNPWTTRRV